MGALRRGVGLWVCVLAVGALSATYALAQQPVRVWAPCAFPHGWNSTDASRQLYGIPNGLDHQCLVEYQPPGRILVPCESPSGPSSTQSFFGLPIRLSYQCVVEYRYTGQSR
jgi:hypothetical protein